MRIRADRPFHLVRHRDVASEALRAMHCHQGVDVELYDVHRPDEECWNLDLRSLGSVGLAGERPTRRVAGPLGNDVP